MTGKQMRTIDEVATFLNISPRTVRRYIDGGKLRAIRMAGTTRIDPDDLQVFIDAHATKPKIVSDP